MFEMTAVAAVIVLAVPSVVDKTKTLFIAELLLHVNVPEHVS